MDNNKLIAYMEKIGITADKPGKYTPGATYKKERWSADYFDGVKVSKEGFIIAFDYGGTNYHLMNQKAKMLKKYLNRYGFRVTYESGFPGCFFMWVLSENDYQELDTIWFFEGLAKNEVEQLIHKYHESGRYESNHNELVKEIKSIMSDYETAYHERVNADKIVKFPA